MVGVIRLSDRLVLHAGVLCVRIFACYIAAANEGLCWSIAFVKSTAGMPTKLCENWKIPYDLACVFVSLVMCSRYGISSCPTRL